MTKLLAVLIGIAAATTAAAQTAAPAATTQEKQQSVRSTTEAASTGTTGAATAKQQKKNVDTSKQSTSMTTDEKNKAIKNVNKQAVNPENSGGVGNTSRQQSGNVAASKEQPKQRPDMSTPEAQKAMQKAATP